jgi:hypothetical protein
MFISSHIDLFAFFAIVLLVLTGIVFLFSFVVCLAGFLFNWGRTPGRRR